MTALFAILFCWAVSFLFAGIEAGLLSVDPVRLRHHVKRKSRPAVRLSRLLEKPERLLGTVLLVTNLADIFALLLLTQWFVLRLGSAGFAIALAIALPVHLFVLNVLPKSLFRRFPFRALARLAGVLELASLLLWPVLQLGSLIGRMMLPRRGTQRIRLFTAREELKYFATETERAGSLTATERVMIHNVVDFRSVRARDVMVPISNVVAITPETPPQSVLALSREKALDRLPVVAANRQPVGLVNALDLLLDNREPRSIKPYLRRIVTTHENDPAYLIIRRLRAARLGLAAVMDQQNHFAGIVTIEDLIRRLVSLSEARPEQV